MSEPLATDEYRKAIEACHPDLVGAELTVNTLGWESVAVIADGRVVLKFPRHTQAAESLRQEAATLEFLRPRLTMPVPNLRVFEGPPVHSRHDMLLGDHLTGEIYEPLAVPVRNHIAEQLAGFFAEMHAVPRDEALAAGAVNDRSPMDPELLRRLALPHLSAHARLAAEEVLRAYVALPPDPRGEVYGYFDAHGWNMAFDGARGHLTGIFDFAGAGFGALHREFVQSSLVSADLTARTVLAYERRTGVRVDRARVILLTGIVGLSEVASTVHDGALLDQTAAMFETWARWPADILERPAE